MTNVRHPDSRPDHLTARFATPVLLTARPVVGTSDLALLIEDQPEGSRARLWRAGEAPGELLPFPVGVGAVLTNDGRWVVDLDDDGGSEVGALVAIAVDGSETVALTPGREPYVLRGIEPSHDGRSIVATVVDEQGFHVLRIPAAPWGEPQVVYSSPVEAWYGQVSADSALVSVDTTDHNPGIRRARVTVVDSRDGSTVGVLDDLPAGPVRGVRFAGIAGDPRLLANTERTGFARPVIWDPTTNERVDFELPELRGEVIPLDWHAESGRILALHVEDGLHRLLEIDESTGAARVVMDGASFADPDVADLHPFQWASYFAPDGTIRAVRSRWHEPRHVIGIDRDGASEVLIAPAPVPEGVPFTSTMIESADGTRVQLWLGRPTDREPIGTVLEVHGGPNLVMVDAYNPSAQAWIEAGFAYATLNYRGSVTFGRDFREGFWGVGGDREIEDVDAAIAFLRSQGLGDPATTFITGASYGGHLTLLSVGRLPDRFRGGLAHVAVADWSAAIAAMNPAVRSVWSSWVPPEMVEHFSAVSYLDDVTASVWINQGSVDTRTPIIGVQSYVDRLGARGGDVVLDIFTGGHEPTGLAMLEHDQRRMTDLALRAIAGRRWSEDAAAGPSEASVAH
ncbi:Dipeptidyl aminopeptidase/acylaminoacyl peptidase [Agromyces sp. CF514]|uniref:S9 family peptidase n=1 Tax=Agromyces sp. CF514 TaxID=1881031 RepID=UPI0008EE5C54|nr:prolyl oligopeptidase family serine peptidase [Agromyces sp. CF514]SFR66533.1 Dipeptidyl aminopeptidase/acylaminoacyl peptidase [Agromyces sp. CF514]